MSSAHLQLEKPHPSDPEVHAARKFIKKARAGVIKQFTGIDSPYEEPLKPELVIDTAEHDLQKSTTLLLDALRRTGHLA